MIKKVIFFTNGNSSEASTWSNVPYLFAKTLELKNIIVHRVDISPNKMMRRVFDKIIVPVIGLLYPKHVYTFDRTILFTFITNRKIKNATKRNKDSDLCIFTTFSFYNKYYNIPTLLFCDWTYEILIKERLNRKLYFFEEWVSKREAEAITNSSIVVSLFPECASSMKLSYPTANIYYLGSNVINSLYKEKIDCEKIIRGKAKSKDILFIGGKYYLEGAQKLVNSFILFSQKHPNYILHLIGIQQSWLKEKYTNVYCHGYLKKDKGMENTLYYNLLLKARFVINPSLIWASYSSTIEAMYFYTPVIITPYMDFVSEFGKTIDFGYYLKDFSEAGISEIIEKMCNEEHYVEMCKIAHEKVKNYTWNSYVEKILALTNI